MINTLEPLRTFEFCILGCIPSNIKLASHQSGHGLWTALLPCVLGGGTPLLLIITTLSIYTECGEMWLWSRTAAADGVLRAISCPLPLQVRCCGGERGGAWWRNNRDHYHWLHRVSSPAPQLSSGHKWRTVFCLYEPQPRLVSVWCR